MIRTFIAGLVILLIALVLQFWFAAAGIFLDLSFATLISFAFIFEFWELLFLVLFAAFVINWQPAVSAEILVFALFPVVAYGIRKALTWESWFAAPVAIVVGFLALYLIAAPGMFFTRLPLFLLDLAAGLGFGALVFYPLRSWKR